MRNLGSDACPRSLACPCRLWVGGGGGGGGGESKDWPTGREECNLFLARDEYRNLIHVNSSNKVKTVSAKRSSKKAKIKIPNKNS